MTAYYTVDIVPVQAYKKTTALAVQTVQGRLRELLVDITPDVGAIDWSGATPRPTYDAPTQRTLARFNQALDRVIDALPVPNDASLAPAPHPVTAEALQVVRDGIDTTTDMLLVDVLQRLADDVLALDGDIATRTILTSEALALAARQQRQILTLRQRLTDRGAA